MEVRDLMRARIGRRWALVLGLALLMLGSQAGVASAATKSASWSNVGWGSERGAGAATAISCAGSTCNAVGANLRVISIVTKRSAEVGVGPAALEYNAISCIPKFCAQTGLKLGADIYGSRTFKLTTIEATATSGPTFTMGPLQPWVPVGLTSISCVKGRDCLAVGVQEQRTATDCSSSTTGTCMVQVPLAVERIGGRWLQIATIPLPVTPVAMLPIPQGQGPWAALAGVSCVGAAACVAVGNYGTTASASEPFAESWNGTAFSEVPMATVTGASDATVNSVSCATATDCLAVGVATVASQSVPFAEQLADGTWNLVTAIQPKGVKGSSLLSVSCVRSGWCATVGNETLNSGTVKPLAEIWNGSGFAVSPFPANTAYYPVTKGGAQLAGVSCTAVNQCVAVGNVYGKTGKHSDWFLSSYATS